MGLCRAADTLNGYIAFKGASIFLCAVALAIAAGPWPLPHLPPLSNKPISCHSHLQPIWIDVEHFLHQRVLFWSFDWKGPAAEIHVRPPFTDSVQQCFFLSSAGWVISLWCSVMTESLKVPMWGMPCVAYSSLLFSAKAHSRLPYSLLQAMKEDRIIIAQEHRTNFHRNAIVCW